uniref:hypothetical protein n=1 Tax=Megasphaera elsdenii TaxID=907 RepID=UPI003FEEC2E7
MQYFLSDEELQKMKNGLKVAMAIPFIDDVEDFIVEAIWEYARNIDGIDPLFNIRSKKLYDVVDSKTGRGWSVKSLQWAFYEGCEFELVIQRAAVYKKAKELGFDKLDSNSDPNLIGAALIKHWNKKINEDAVAQNVSDKRIMVLLKTEDKRRFAIYEESIKQYSPEELYWQWTSPQKNGLKGYRHSDNMCVYRWYPSQTQLFERFVLPKRTQVLDITPVRLKKDQLVDILLPYLEEHQ